jgi:DNA polymerase elongation subunit (family B)
MKVYIYDLYVQSKHINKDMVIQNSFVINWAAAWLDSEWNIKGRIISEVLTPKEAVKQNDKRILENLFYMMDKADYICGHNSNNFDVKKLKWRFMKHGWGYPHESKKLDSFRMSAETKPASRGLEHLSVELGGKRKMGLDLHEWQSIVETGDPKLLRKADKYCRGDVREGVMVFGKYARAIEQSGRRLVK